MVMNEENRKKILIGSIVAVITLVIVVAGATYAFFSLNVSGDATNTNVDIETGSADLVSIQKGAENMHINLSVSDMAKNNPNKAYYATDTEDNYKLTESDGTLTFATVAGTNKEESDCTAKVTITMDISKDSMGEVLTSGDATLHLENGEYKEDIDLSSLLTEGGDSSVTKEIDLVLTVSASDPSIIKGYLKVNNTGSDQSYLAGKELNITITVDNLVCGIIIPNLTNICSSYNNLEECVKTEDINIASLTEEPVGGMYRYQGARNVSNWICFGTTDQEECKNNVDKYMYRIIGITEEGQLYLLKETFIKEIKEDKNIDSFVWNSNSRVRTGSYWICPDGKCPEWNEADLFIRINGKANGTNAGSGGTIDSPPGDTDIFIDNSYYDYLKSGDKVNGGEEESDWYKLIITHSWHYGDTSESDINVKYNGDAMYAIETGNRETTHYIPNGSGGRTSEPFTWKNTIDAKISLMYIHDVLYAYPEENRSVYTDISESWIDFRKDGYNKRSQYEFLSTRYSFIDEYEAWYFGSPVFGSSFLNSTALRMNEGVRPVFYLDGSKIALNGKGTAKNPYYITNL